MAVMSLNRADARPNVVDLSITLNLLPLDGGGWVGVKKKSNANLLLNITCFLPLPQPLPQRGGEFFI